MPKVGKTSAKKRRRMNKKYRMEKRLKAMLLEQQLNSNGGEKPSSDNTLECNEEPALCNETSNQTEGSCGATATESVVASTASASDTGTVTTVKDNEEEKEMSVEVCHDNHHEEKSHHDEKTVKKSVAKVRPCRDGDTHKRHVEELRRMIYEGERLEEVLKIVKILTGQLDKMKQNESQEKGQVGRRHQSQHQHWQLKLIHKFLDKLHEESGRGQRGRKRESYTRNQNGSHQPIQGDGSGGPASGHYHVPR